MEPTKKASKRFRAVLFWLVCTVSFLLICISVVPRALGQTLCAMHDGSMADYPKGALVLVSPIRYEQIQKGDVLVFSDPDSSRCFTRTVLRVWPEYQQIVTGVSVDSEPDPVSIPYRCAVGKAVRCIPLLGYPAMVVHSLWGKVILALLYIIWIAVEIELHSVSKRRETPT